MRLPAPFTPVGEHIGCSLPGGQALFTTRFGGVSRAPFDSLNLAATGLAGALADDPEAVVANRDRVAQAIGVPADRTAYGRQVHGRHVRRIRTADEAAVPDEADGQATALRGVALAVLTADCLPVALVAPEAVAMIHAGWRGLAAGILDEGVAALRELGADGVVRAAIGPGAGVCCYEAGDEVHAAFATLGPDVRRGANADLKLAARRQLASAGVGEVHDVGLCTLCAPAGMLFSHRRDGGTTGRQAGIAWRS